MCTGEWFNADPEAVIAQALSTGAGPNVSDAYTINGLPGPLYNCSAKGKFSEFHFHRVNLIYTSIAAYLYLYELMMMMMHDLVGFVLLGWGTRHI